MYAVFSDILGFSALTKELPADCSFMFSDHYGYEVHPKTKVEWQAAEGQSRLLQFYEKHDTAAVDKPESPLYQAIFSDCGFTVYENIEGAISYSVNFMRLMVGHFIPIRIGVAEGNFTRFLYQSSEEPWPHHDAIFLGSAITRAAAAESVKQKGIGIFLDESVMGAVAELFGKDVLVPLESASRGCSWQINWQAIELKGEYRDRFVEFCWTRGLNVENVCQILAAMARAAPQIDEVQEHYAATLRMIGSRKQITT